MAFWFFFLGFSMHLMASWPSKYPSCLLNILPGTVFGQRFIQLWNERQEPGLGEGNQLHTINTIVLLPVHCGYPSSVTRLNLISFIAYTRFGIRNSSIHRPQNTNKQQTEGSKKSETTHNIFGAFFSSMFPIKFQESINILFSVRRELAVICVCVFRCEFTFLAANKRMISYLFFEFHCAELRKTKIVPKNPTRFLVCMCEVVSLCANRYGLRSERLAIITNHVTQQCTQHIYCVYGKFRWRRCH